MSRVLAVLLNYDNAAYTIEATRAVLAQEPAPDVLVVDNGSRPGVAAAVRAGVDVEVLELPDNRGVPGGLAPGLVAALDRGYEQVLVVLNDTALEPGALVLLQARLAGDPRVAAVAPLQVRYDDPERVVTSGSRLHAGPWLVSTRDAGRTRQQVQAEHLSDPDYLDLTCLLVRAEVLRTVGLPRAEFRFYWEDVEWGVRVRRAGWRLNVEPAAVVRHRVSGTLSTSKSSTASYYQQRNRLLAKRLLDGRLGAARVLAAEPVLLLGRLLVRGADGGGTRVQARAAVDHVLGRPYPRM